MKKIITHINPDLDAVASAWLIKRFLPGWEEAEVEFITSSISIEERKDPDENPNILLVDVGRGKLDHHQLQKVTSATELCFDYIKKNRKGYPLKKLNNKALIQIVRIVTEIDNARNLNWEESKMERVEFYLHRLLDGLRGLAASDREVLEIGFKMLDAILLNLKNKIRAKEELKKGIVFSTSWGKGIAVETGNKNVLWEGQLAGFSLVVKKDPENGGVEIYSRYDSKVNLKRVYNEVRKKDPGSDWFLHASKKLLLNQASVNPNMKPTRLSLREIIEILQRN